VTRQRRDGPAQSHEVLRWDGTNWSTIVQPVEPGETCRLLGEMSPGSMLLKDGARVRPWKNGTFNEEPGLRSVKEILRAKENSFWAATRTAGVRYMVEGETAIGPLLTNVTIESLYKDRFGSVWVSTAGDGIFRIRQTAFQTFSTNQGLPHENVWAIRPGRRGLWMATENGLYQAGSDAGSSREWRFDGPAAGSHLAVNTFYAVLEDKRGRIWAGGRGGIFASQGEKLLPLEDVTLGPRIKTKSVIYEDRDGKILFGTASGLFQIAPDATDITSAVKLCDFHVRGILRASDGALWIGTERDGLHRFGPNAQSWVTNQPFSSGAIGPALEDEHGCVWFGSNAGVYRWRAGKLAGFSARDGLPEDIVLNVIDDQQGYFWMNGNQGIYRIRKDELHKAVENPEFRPGVKCFGKKDGVLFEGNGMGTPSACVESDGRLWFATGKGAVFVDPREVLPRIVQPSIEEVNIDGSAIHRLKTITNRVLLKPSSGRVLYARFFAPELLKADAEFEHRLIGLSERWIRAGDDRVAWYSNLDPGAYGLEVRAREPGGNWNSGGAEFAFSISPYFYQTKLFFISSAIAAIAMVWGIEQLRTKRRAELFALQSRLTLEQERSRIARDMHDDIGAEIGQLQILAALARRESFRGRSLRHLEKIEAVGGDLAKSIDEIIWVVDPQNDTLASLLRYMRSYAAEFLQAAGIKVIFEWPDIHEHRTISADTRHQLFMTFKEALHNIAQHSKAAGVKIELTWIDPKLLFRITDNGVGFDAAENSVSSRGNGLHNMRKRIEGIGGRFEIESKRGVGTQIVFEVECKAA
jgi:signal transduction histidine kinase